MQPLPMAEWIAVLFDHIIDKYGGTTSLNEFRVMNQITICYLRGNSPCSFPCLDSKLPVKRSTISRVVTRLVQRGYIREEIDPQEASDLPDGELRGGSYGTLQLARGGAP